MISVMYNTRKEKMIYEEMVEKGGGREGDGNHPEGS